MSNHLKDVFVQKRLTPVVKYQFDKMRSQTVHDLIITVEGHPAGRQRQGASARGTEGTFQIAYIQRVNDGYIGMPVKPASFQMALDLHHTDIPEPEKGSISKKRPEVAPGAAFHETHGCS